MNGPRDDDSTPDDAELRRAARERVEQVEPVVAERLAQMRRTAVAELDARRARQRTPLFWAGGLAAAAAALALTLALLLPGAIEPETRPLLAADVDELEAIADLEVLEELEFLAWLEQEQLDAGQS